MSLQLTDELRLLGQSSPAGFGYVTSLHYDETNDAAYSTFLYPPHVERLNKEIVTLVSGAYLDQGYTGIIVEMPPRHGKSEMCSKFTPAWYVGAFPGKRVALASYEADFAAEWGGKARELEEEWGPVLFGVEVDYRSRARDHWQVRRITQGRPRKDPGGMITAGAGGPLTGKGAHLLIVDDPFKNHVEAQSKTIRDRVWNWWTSTARTRLEPGGVAIIIHTRWHEDDLIGRLLAAQGDSDRGVDHPLYDPLADKWVRIKFPAIAKTHDDLGRLPGDPLWPERYNRQALDRLKATLGSYLFEALYQQEPTPGEGGLFQADWFKFIDVEEAETHKLHDVVRYWDLAATDDTLVKKADDPDYTAGARMGKTRDGKYIIFDVNYFKKSPENVEQEIKRTAYVDRRGTRISMEEERGASGKSLISMYKRLLKGFLFKGDRVTGSKSTRAMLYSAACERGDVMVVRGTWNEEFMSQHTFFPFGAHDDIVDACSGAFNQLEEKRSSKLTSF